MQHTCDHTHTHTHTHTHAHKFHYFLSREIIRDFCYAAAAYSVHDDVIYKKKLTFKAGVFFGDSEKVEFGVFLRGEVLSL